MTYLVGTQHEWRIMLRSPAGELYVVNDWQKLSVTHNFEGSTIEIEMPWAAPTLAYFQELLSDLLLYRDNVLLYRFRVLNIGDSIGPEGHTVGISGGSYEYLLNRRVVERNLYYRMDQHDWCWWLVNYAQSRQSLGIRRVTGGSRVVKLKSISAGMVINEAIDEVASTDNGFDWWIDQRLGLNMQTPRRLKRHDDFEWSLGANVATVKRESAANEYASGVLVTGATSETSIPQGGGKPDRKYPPPAPAYRQLSSLPYGLWVQSVSYSDVVTNASLVSKAVWILGQSSKFKPSYSIELQPGAWDPLVGPGSLITLRVRSEPRFYFKVPIRLEELKIEVGPDGSENISCTAMADAEETKLAMSGAPYPHLELLDEPDEEEQVYGLSKTRSRVDGVDELASLFLMTANRIRRVAFLTDDTVSSGQLHLEAGQLYPSVTPPGPIWLSGVHAATIPGQVRVTSPTANVALTLDFGDGTTPYTSTPTTTATINVDHTYAEPGVYEMTATQGTGDTAVVSTLAVDVGELYLSAHEGTDQVYQVESDDVVVVHVEEVFVPHSDDPVTIDWGDGTASDATYDTGSIGAWFATHTWAVPGEYSYAAFQGDDRVGTSSIEVVEPVVVIPDASMAVAGSPGYFLPDDALPPADFAAMSHISPSPVEPWVEGEYVTLGDATEVYWTGEEWAVGQSPPPPDYMLWDIEHWDTDQSWE